MKFRCLPLSERKDLIMEKRPRKWWRLTEVDEQQEYIGNIWGWKFSWISLGIILFFLILMGLRYAYLQSTGQWPAEYEPMEIIK